MNQQDPVIQPANKQPGQHSKSKWPLLIASFVIALAIMVPILIKKYKTNNWKNAINQTETAQMTNDYELLGTYSLFGSNYKILKISSKIDPKSLVELSKKLHSSEPKQYFSILDQAPPDLDAWITYRKGGTANATQAETSYILDWDTQHYIAIIDNDSGKTKWRILPYLGGGVLGNNIKFKDLVETNLE